MKELRSCYIAVKKEDEEEVLFAAENPEELYKKANGNFNDIKVLWITRDGTAQDVDVEEEFMLYIEGRDIKMKTEKTAIKCPCCGREVSEMHKTYAVCNVCDVIINLDIKCPDCGAYTYEANYPGDDPSEGYYCYHSHKTISDNTLTREENIKLFGEVYTDCEAIHDKYVKASKTMLKDNVSSHIQSNSYVLAYEDILAMQRKEFECSESECDDCPIVKALTAKNIIGTDITHGQYATCSDFVSYMEEYMSERSER